MMFRTELIVPEAQLKLNYQKPLLFIGSCFTEHIGNKCLARKYTAAVNPFGVIYNPSSVANSLDFVMDNYIFQMEDLFSANGLWNSFYHHSRFSHPNAGVVLQDINNEVRDAHLQLKQASHLFITWGSAHVFENKKSGTIVSNNHKLPAQLFNRYRLSVKEIVATYSRLLKKLEQFNPDLKVIFTVSPVRHLKDGAHGNQLSKSTLLLAIDELSDHFAQVDYFPAYEFFMDDLRDYRFYDSDMCHPSTQGIDYVWGKFIDTYVSAEERSLGSEVEKISRAMEHRVFNPDSDAHLRFLEKFALKVQALKISRPYMDLSDFEEYFLGN